MSGFIDLDCIGHSHLGRCDTGYLCDGKHRDRTQRNGRTDLDPYGPIENLADILRIWPAEASIYWTDLLRSA